MRDDGDMKRECLYAYEPDGPDYGDPEEQNRFVRLDWAMKRILRDKANFGVLSGFLSELLREDITVTELIESQSNQDDDRDKYNVVDLKAKNEKGHIYIFEIQISHQSDFMQRMLYSVAKSITEQVGLGHVYADIKKVYSINIVYFNLGRGSDYIYHGITEFTGYHDDEKLELSERELAGCRVLHPRDFFPEYFLIRVNEFNKVARTPLDEWIEYFRSGRIPVTPKAKGLAEARKTLDLIKMSRAERDAYVKYTMQLASYERDYDYDIKSNFAKGRAEGIAEGRAEGRAEGIESVAKKMLSMGMTHEQIELATGLTPAQIDHLY